MWPFRKPTDPAAEHIARLNAEAKMREAGYRHPPTQLRDFYTISDKINLTQADVIRKAIGDIQAYQGSVTADQLVAGTITADNITFGSI